MRPSIFLCLSVTGSTRVFFRQLAFLTALGVTNGCSFAVDDGGAVMGEFLRLAAPTSRTAAVREVCGRGPTVFGIDVSKWQGDIDWQAAADDGVKFAIIRTSDGLASRDPKFEQNWEGAKAAGIVRGVYQFFRSDEDPVEQANFMLDMMGELEPGDLPPTMDLESVDGVDNATRIERMRQWFDVVDNAVGATSLVYTGGYFWDSHVDTDEFSHHPLWHAGYTGGDCPTTVSASWPTWTVWQYASSPDPTIDGRNVAGIAGDVDQNRFNGTLDDLEAIVVGEPVCGDGRCGFSEDHASCAVDCPTCEPLPPEGGVVSEEGLCFTGGGPEQFLRRVTDAGDDAGLIWTHTTDQSEEDNYGLWSLSFVEAGRYRLEAFTDSAYAESRQARYRVRHNGLESTFVVDQTAVDGWVVVAPDLFFAAGGDQSVFCADNTGEPLSGNVQLVFDALRLTRLDPGPAGEGEGEPAASGEGEDETAGDDDGNVSDVGDDSESAQGTAPRRIVVQPMPRTVVGGCTQTSSSMVSLWTMVLLLLGRRRRQWSRIRGLVGR
jgi:GH25 family lysozyme M1 (1,4-beta-N-acetylmuramidase)